MSVLDRAREPLAIGVCSWSLQVKNIPELAAFCDRLGTKVVQIACGDPVHASWDEGDDLPRVALESGLSLAGAMLGFPGEDYTTPAIIQATGGFGPVELRAERLDRLRWAVERTVAMGLSDLMFHAGFLPPPGDSGRRAFLDTLAKAAGIASEAGLTVAFETGQETAALLRTTLDELAMPNVKVNFDPANMLLYDMDDPIRAIEVLGPDIRTVHAKDARRPRNKGDWGEEVPLGQGEVNMNEFVSALKRVGYTGPLCVEREVGNQAGRLRDVGHGIAVLRKCIGQ